MEVHIEGSGPEWYISCMLYSQDTPFWSGRLDMEVKKNKQTNKKKKENKQL